MKSAKVLLPQVFCVQIVYHSMMSVVVPPFENRLIGIMGSGQLGRMLAMAAAQLGYRCCIYAPPTSPSEPHGVACDVSHSCVHGQYDDVQALSEFAGRVEVVTVETENIPLSTLELIENLSVLRPGVLAVQTTQDRLLEKSFVRGLGLPVVPFASVNSLDDLKDAHTSLGGCACILKSRKGGYDGRQQYRIKGHAIASLSDDGRADGAQQQQRKSERLSNDETLDQAISSITAASGSKDAHTVYAGVLEKSIELLCEVSVICARDTSGASVTYPVVQNLHQDGILVSTTYPHKTRAIDAHCERATLISQQIAHALCMVGCLCVEFFIDQQNYLYVNELAPRVHNSGHWTIDGANISQFEQHIRAVCSQPLLPVRARPIYMENLIGNVPPHNIMLQETARVHWYGKQPRPKRKLGHITYLM